MRLKSSFEFVDMGSEIVAVPIGDGTIRGVFKLNKEGFRLFELLQSDVELSDIIAELDDVYDNHEEIADYANSFVELLRSYNLILD